MQLAVFRRNFCCSASDSAYLYASLRRVVCLSCLVCLSHSALCLNLKLFDEFKCHLAVRVAGSNKWQAVGDFAVLNSCQNMQLQNTERSWVELLHQFHFLPNRFGPCYRLILSGLVTIVRHHLTRLASFLKWVQLFCSDILFCFRKFQQVECFHYSQ